MAISLAAQDSLKNLFGSITILLDRPFKIGERIIFAPFDGTVEGIGFRSTIIRTAAGHLVSIPNSRIVNDPIENVDRKPYIRRSFNINIAMSTPPDLIKRAVNTIRDILERDGIRENIHSTIDGQEYFPKVYFNEFNPNSLNITILYWFAPPDQWKFTAHSEIVNLKILDELERIGVKVAFPP